MSKVIDRCIAFAATCETVSQLKSDAAKNAHLRERYEENPWMERYISIGSRKSVSQYASIQWMKSADWGGQEMDDEDVEILSPLVLISNLENKQEAPPKSELFLFYWHWRKLARNLPKEARKWINAVLEGGILKVLGFGSPKKDDDPPSKGIELAFHTASNDYFIAKMNIDGHLVGEMTLLKTSSLLHGALAKLTQRGFSIRADFGKHGMGAGFPTLKESK